MLTFDVDAESVIIAHDARAVSYASAMTHQAFGATVGTRRIVHMLQSYDVPATFFVPGFVAERYPATIELLLEGGFEVAHHSFAHHPPISQQPGEERRDFERALAALERLGAHPKGYRAPGWDASYHSIDLVGEYGLSYDSSLMDDDRPYLLDTRHATIVELPPQWGLDDWEQYAFLPSPPIGTRVVSPLHVRDMWNYELDAAREQGTLFLLTCHPCLSGRPGRLKALAEVIEHGLAAGDVQFESAFQLASSVAASAPPARRLRPVTGDGRAAS